MDSNIRRKLLVVQLLIPLTIATLLSFAITFINYGFTADFLRNWGKGFLISLFLVPIAARVIPHLGRGVRALVGNRPMIVIRSITAISIAVMMETIITLAVTLIQYGLTPGWTSIWAMSFVKALPIGFLIGFTMTFIVVPYMQKLGAAMHAANTQKA